MAKSRYPGFVPASHYVTVVDEGSFSHAGLAKAGIQPVVEALNVGSPTTVPVTFDDYEAKFCQALKGGGNPPCRVHLSSTNGQMAVRLCDKLNEPGTVVVVKDAHEALARSKEFCTCARNKPDETRKKCARKVKSGNLSGIASLASLATTTPEVFTPQQAAQGMLKRYSSPKVAAEMAWHHAMSHDEADARRKYWEQVNAEIRRAGGVHGLGSDVSLYLPMEQSEGIQPDGTFTIARAHFQVYMPDNNHWAQNHRRLTFASLQGRLSVAIEYADGRAHPWYAGTTPDNLVTALYSAKVDRKGGVDFWLKEIGSGFYSADSVDLALYLPAELYSQLKVWLDSKLERGFN